MIEHYWTVFCSKSVIDKDANTISLFDALEQITVYGAPPPGGKTGGIPMENSIVSFWGRTEEGRPAKGTVRYFIEYHGDGDDRTTDPHEITIDLSEYTRSRTRALMNVLPLMGAGKHWVRVFLKQENQDDWDLVASVPYHVEFKPEGGSK